MLRFKVEYIDLRTGNLWADGAYLKPKLMMAFDIKVSSRQIAKASASNLDHHRGHCC